MNNPVGWRANALPLLFVAAGLILTGVLTDQPYTVGHAAETELRLAIRHSGRSVEQCINRSVESMEDLAPNMRMARVCPRGKSPMSVLMTVSDADAAGRVPAGGVEEQRFEERLAASGLHDDGVIAAFQRFPLTPGVKRLKVQVDDGAGPGWQLDTTFVASLDSVTLLAFTDRGFEVLQPNHTSAGVSDER